MNLTGLDANLALVDDLDDKLMEQGGTSCYELDDSGCFELLDCWALAGSMDEEPTSLWEALEGPDGAAWQKGLDKEISCLEAVKMWRVAKAPEGAKAIPHSIVLKTKCGMQNKIMECRVRIVAGGHRQHAGIDFNCDKTFYMAVKSLTQHAVLAHGVKKDWLMQHIDVKSAYLYAKLKGNTPMYMTPPIGYLKPGQEGMVLEI